MNELIILLLGLTIHEFGHFIHYLYRGHNPRFVWLYIGPGVEPRSNYISVKDNLINIFVAVISGSIALILLNASNIIMFAYLAGCFVDLANAQNLIIYLFRKTIKLNTNINKLKIVVEN